MRLDRLDLRLRPRTPWEAIDLGTAMVRRHAGAIWAPWFALVLPCALLVHGLAVLLDMPQLGLWLLWWLKPWFDRVPLYVLSRAVFGATPSLRQVLRARELRPDGALLAWLTWRRLHPSRALLLPVDMLEGVRGPRRAPRVAVLERNQGGTALALMWVCIAFEIALWLSCFALALLFVPLEFLDDAALVAWETFAANPPAWAEVLAYSMLGLAMCAIEPFYVGAGFALYLNRRTQLEAWDLELEFRRMAERLDGGAAPASAGAGAAAGVAAARESGATPVVRALGLALVCAVAAWVGPSTDARAAPAAEVTVPRTASSVPIGDTASVFGDHWEPPQPAFDRGLARGLDDPALAPRGSTTQWRLKNAPTEREAAGMPGWLKTLLGGLGAGIGLVLEYGLWLLAALLLALLLWRLRHWFGADWAARAPAPAPPGALVQGDARAPDDTPRDVPGSARRLWREGRQREALALLYRGGVAGVSEALGAPFPPGATEAECLRRARRLAGAPRLELFTRIVRAWQAAAYARRLPDEAQFEALLAEWPAAFGAPA